MTKPLVINSSPLIVLFKSGLADLLPQLFDTITVPKAVYREVTSIKADAAAIQLPKTKWLQIVNIEINSAIAAWDLGPGESAVLSFAITHPEYRAMVDDAAARRCARTLKIATLGTGGALVLAKKKGLINSIIAPLEAVQDAGLWLSNDVITILKQQAGEI